MPRFETFDRTETLHHYDKYGVFIRTERNAIIPAGTDIPANSTLIEPPQRAGRRVPVFNEGAQTWSLVNDFRGRVVFDTATGQRVKIDALGELPPNTTEDEPEEGAEWNGVRWVQNLSRLRSIIKDQIIGAAELAKQRGLDGIGIAPDEYIFISQFATWDQVGDTPAVIQVHVDAGLTIPEAIAAVQNQVSAFESVLEDVYVAKINAFQTVDSASSAAQMRSARSSSLTTINGLYT